MTATSSATMSNLNAHAKPFVPQNIQAARERIRAMDEERSLFMTFSNGSPLTWQEISDYFTSEYGPCVKYVYIHTRHKRDPMFGRIIFTTLELPRVILGDHEIARILVNGKPVWLKKFMSQSRRGN